MGAHTPGPWITRASNREHGTIYVEAGSPQWLVATAAGQGAANEANARLIAAAPDLLEAVKDIDWDETGTPTGWPNQDRVLALIAKAEGK